MAAPIIEMNGTGGQIAERLQQFKDESLHVVISRLGGSTDVRPLLLREIEERWQSMNPRPASRDYLHEGRSGDMFGHGPAE